jgi:hypothetical protein
VTLDSTTVEFTPDPDFTGVATFDYTVSDTEGNTDTATVTVSVNPEGSFNLLSAELWEYVEVDIHNPTWSDNPFDLEASVTFTHQTSGTTITTGMFYDNNNTWSFRFTGMELGNWSFTTNSADADLDGLTGTIAVNPNDNPNAYGFTTKSDVDPNKWARYIGNDGEMEVFVPQLLMAGDVSRYSDASLIEAGISTFIDGHGFTGFHVPELAGRWFDYNQADDTVFNSMTNPDIQTFEVLEQIILQTHQAGGVVHLWAWGDRARQETPDFLVGGKNGVVDQRLQRYIAARLGALPGWSLGYGFDLDEWVKEPEIHAWQDFMQSQLGWFHFLGGRPEGPNFGTDHSAYTSWNQELDYSSYEHHRPTYDVYVASLEELPDRPVMSEDRFRVRSRTKDYTLDETRQGLWHSTMAGGVANIWGNLTPTTDTVDQFYLSNPYPNQDQLKTYSVFFFDNGRFLADMTRANELTDGYALKTADDSSYVFYKENTSSLQVDLSGMSGSQKVIAVDTKAAYSEIDLGTLAPGSHTIQLDYSSDWAIAIGLFDSSTQTTTNQTLPPIIESNTISDTDFNNDIATVIETAGSPTIYTNLFNSESVGEEVNLVGSEFGDRLIGDGRANVLEGGAGQDELTGGGGPDVFVYRNLTDGVDTITDFDGDDLIHISASGFGGVLEEGMALNGDMVLFDTSTYTLSIDVDGTGPAEAVAIATFTSDIIQPDQIQEQIQVIA